MIAAVRGRVGPRGGVGGAERERGPDALAAGADQVRGDLGEERIGSLYRLVQCGLDPCQIGGDRLQTDGDGWVRRGSRPRHGNTVGSDGNNHQAEGVVLPLHGRPNCRCFDSLTALPDVRTGVSAEETAVSPITLTR